MKYTFVKVDENRYEVRDKITGDKVNIVTELNAKFDRGDFRKK